MNTIPNNVLSEFVESKVGYNNLGNIVNTRCHFLWNKDNIERYRIDVWIEEYIKAWDLNIKKIGHSFFVHYNNETEEITDKTLIGV